MTDCVYKELISVVCYNLWREVLYLKIEGEKFYTSTFIFLLLNEPWQQQNCLYSGKTNIHEKLHMGSSHQSDKQIHLKKGGKKFMSLSNNSFKTKCHTKLVTHNPSEKQVSMIHDQVDHIQSYCLKLQC